MNHIQPRPAEVCNMLNIFITVSSTYDITALMREMLNLMSDSGSHLLETISD